MRLGMFLRSCDNKMMLKGQYVHDDYYSKKKISVYTASDKIHTSALQTEKPLGSEMEM